MPTIPENPRSLRVAVVGGGAAGFFAAVNTAEKNPRAQITIFEAGQKPLQKVFISGGGRCNLTHACFDPNALSEFYPRGQKELRSLFARFQPRDTMAWYETRGLRLKTEPDGRVFPVSDCSQDVIDCLQRAAAQFGVRVYTGSRVEGIEYQQDVRDGAFTILSQGKRWPFDVCILSTGYSPPGWKLAESLGHQVLPPVPSLFPFTVKAPVLAGLQGISVLKARGRLTVLNTSGKASKHEAEGPVLITHTGLSGPLIYRLSAWGARDLAEARYQAQLQLDWLPDCSEDALREQLVTQFQAQLQKKIGNTGFEGLSHRLWLALLEASGADLEQKVETFGKKGLNRLLEVLKRLPLPVTGKSPSKEEFVSCGGVPLKELDFRTMESRRVPGLYFGGEILNIDALTGGFNFQACWSEGWVISEALKSVPTPSR
jgi:predicted Rossmann fold flavoprotein